MERAGLTGIGLQIIHDRIKSNQVFSRMAEYSDVEPFAQDVREMLKAQTFGLGPYAPYKSREQAKRTADAFETAASMYQKQAGTAEFKAWCTATFSDPILDASEA